MAIVHVQMLSICDGNNHAVMELTKGAQVRQVNMDIATLRSAITQDDIEGFCKVAIKILNEGKTAAQLRAALQAGFDVTV